MSAKKVPSLFEALGNSFTIPTDEAGLRKLFNTYDLNGDGAIDLREFQSLILQFDEGLGLIANRGAIGRDFRKFAGSDVSLGFSEFCGYMLHRAATM
jgi:hypothetical protein